MPQALAAIPAIVAGWATAGAAAMGVGLAGQVVVGQVVTALTTLAFTGGAALAAGALANRPRPPKPSSVEQELQQPIPPRMWHYGRVKVSGPYAFYETGMEDDRTALFKAILLSARQIDAYEKHFLDDKEVLLTGTAVQDERYLYGGPTGSMAHLSAHLGTDSQTVDPLLSAEWPTEWTADHRLRGTAYVVGRFRSSQAGKYNDRYPNGEPTYKALIRASRVYDPRKDSTVAGGSGTHRQADKSTWEWSDNVALCVRDYLTHADGYNRPIGKIDLPSFMAFADLCDELVPLKAGGTEKRYRIATTVYLTEARKDVLARLLEAGNATLYPTRDGKVAIRGGEWNAPTVTLDADQGHILDATFSQGVDALSRYNEIALQFTSPDHDYTEVEAEPWQDAAAIAETGIIETRPLDLLQVPSHGQARRLAKIRMKRDNPVWMGEVRTNFVGLDCIGERVVTIKWPELQIDGPFYIESDIEFLEDGTGMRFSVRSADSTAYDWDPATEEGDPPPVPPDTSLEPGDEGVYQGQPSDLKAVGGEGQATITWRNPNMADFRSVRVWRALSGALFDDAVAVGGRQYGWPDQEGRYVDAAAAGTYDYWVTAEDDLRRDSLPIGPDQAVVSEDADVAAIFAAMAMPPGAARQALYRALVSALKQAGVWSRLTGVYVLAAHAEQAGRLNLRAPGSNTLVAVNAPSFTVDRGFACGGTSRLESGFVYATGLQRDNNHVSAWSLSNVAESHAIVGADQFAINPRGAANEARLRSSANATDTHGSAQNGAGFKLISRDNGSNFDYYEDGELTVTEVRASEALSGTRDFWVGGWNSSAPQYSTRRIAAASWGTSLTDAEITALHDALHEFLAAVGAPV